MTQPGGPPPRRPALQGVFTDTRKPERDALFVALIGENHDGSAYAVAAAEAGAAAVLVPERSAAKVAAELAQSAALLAAHDTGRALALLAQAGHRARSARRRPWIKEGVAPDRIISIGDTRCATSG